MKTYLVTGAAGFIGFETARQLLDQEVRVIGIDNMNDYYDVSLKKHRLGFLEHENFTFVEGDIEDRPFLTNLFDQHSFDCVINLAARAGVRYSMENPYVYATTNFNGVLNLLEEMRRKEIKKMVLASTSSLYAGQEMPFSESLAVNTPISPYAATKKGAEVMAYTYHYLYGMDISVVRYFTVYGPAGRPDMSVFRFIRWIDEGTPIELFGDGSQARDFTYVTDIARGTISAAQKETGYQVINLGGGNNPISMTEVIKTIEKKLGKKAKIDQKPFHKADMKETWADIDQASKLLGWSPKVSLEQGLDLTIKWYLENRDFCLGLKI